MNNVTRPSCAGAGLFAEQAAVPGGASHQRNPAANVKPRLGFLGVGWIGRHRLEAIARSGVAEIAAIADLSPTLVSQAAALAPNAISCRALGDLLALELDGIVIATPSALHADQCIEALARGIAVFCQKPLGRTAQEARAVIQAARQADLSLAVDFSYRQITGIRMVRELCREGALGNIYAIEMVFHNAYGPDKAWFYDCKQSGGGCVMDLGVHLVDLALWNTGFPTVGTVNARLFSQGKPVIGRADVVEDYAVAQFDLQSGAAVQLTCSWKLPLGSEALISGAFYGTKGGAAFHNLDGSFYRFVAKRFDGTRCTVLTDAAEDWGGRAAVAWAQGLADGARFNPQADQIAAGAEVLDAIYRSTHRSARVRPESCFGLTPVGEVAL